MRVSRGGCGPGASSRADLHVARKIPRVVRAAGRVVAALALVQVLASAVAASDRQQIGRAVDHLLASQLPSGLLSYDFDLLTGAPTGRDHIARQSGVISFLAEYYLDSHDERVRPAIEKALDAFGRLSLPVGKRWIQSALEQTGLLSVPVGRWKLQRALGRLGLLFVTDGHGKLLGAGPDYASAPTGATALALLAELQYAEATGDQRFRALREAWVKGLLTLHIPRGGFRMGPTSIDTSPFYDGEAWLALAYYSRLHPRDERVRSLLAGLDVYLVHRYRDETRTGFYQWGAMAAVERLRATSDDRFVRFLAAQAQKATQATASEKAPGSEGCADVEGLVSAAAVLRERRTDDLLVGRIEERIDRVMTGARRLQIPPQARRLAFADGAYLVSPKLAHLGGAFLESAAKPYTRIDFTGHCLSAMTKLQRYGLASRRSGGTTR